MDPLGQSTWALRKRTILIFKGSLIVLQRAARVIKYLCVDWSLWDDLDC